MFILLYGCKGVHTVVTDVGCSYCYRCRGVHTVVKGVGCSYCYRCRGVHTVTGVGVFILLQD